MMKTGLKVRPSRSSFSISENISSATFSVTSDHSAMILFFRSPLVMAPSRYCCSTRMTSSLALATTSGLLFGMMRSLMPIDSPDFVAYVKPVVFSPSSISTVSCSPWCR